MRIISFLLMLIISQMSFAAVTTSIDTVPASSSLQTVYAVQLSSSSDLSPYVSTSLSACLTYALSYAQSIYSTRSFNSAAATATSTVCTIPYTINGVNFYNWSTNVRTKQDVIYTCPFGYTLSGTSCTKETTTDSCTELAGTVYKLNVPAAAIPMTVCFDTCTATFPFTVAISAPGSVGYYSYNYTLTGATCTAADEIGQYVDDATAAAGNAAQAEADRVAAVDAAIESAKAGCGGAGTYTTGTFNGATIVSCKGSDTSTTVNDTSSTTTVTNEDGTTTTTTTTVNNTSSSTNNSTTTVNADGTTSGSGGSSGSTTGTTTTTVTRAPDGSVVSSSTSTTSSAEDTSGSFDAAGAGSALSELLADKEDINAMIESGGPGLPGSGSDGFGMGSTWYWPTGSCTSFSVDISISDLNGNMTGDKMCDYWNSVANPVFTWVLYLMTALYVYYLWDRTLADVAKAG